MKNPIVVVGASFGGIEALSLLLGGLPAGFPAPVLVVQHVPAHSPGLLPAILARAGPLPVSHPRPNESLQPGRVYVAPPDLHMLVQHGYVRLSHGPRENFVRPGIDPLFRSAALAYGPAVIAIVLTGHLDDGTAGLQAVKDCGGTTIVQEPSEAAAPSMPQSALHQVAVDHCVGLREMPALLGLLVRDDPAGSSVPSRRSVLEIENRIAAGEFTAADWGDLERLSAPSGLNCPHCRSALHDVGDERLLRFRCRAGHAYSAHSLLSGQAEAREMQLSTLLGAAIEEAALARRMARVPAFAGDPGAATALRARLELVERQAAQVTGWLHAMTGPPNPELAAPRERGGG